MKKLLSQFMIGLAAIMLLPSSVFAKTNMGTINLKVGESITVYSEPSTYYTVSGSWSQSGNSFYIGSKTQRSCKITGLSVGTSTLQWLGVVGTWDADIYWTVIVTDDPVIKASSINLNKTSLSLKVRQEETLTATVKPEDATDKSITWSSDNSVVTVSPWGTVTANAEGTATITCKANDGSGVSATCSVTVEGELPIPANSIKQLALGRAHSMILKTDGSLWACGDNEYGQLGDGTNDDSNIPKQVMTNVTDVAASLHTMILKKDGSLWACGYNEYGQLGDGTNTKCNIPKQVMTDVADVAVGFAHTMILKTDGSLWACGYNEFGQLGDGTKINRSIPKQIMTGVMSVSAGMWHTMILKTDGSLWACGYDSYGQLAAGNYASSDLITKKPMQVMTGVKAVETGDLHTMILKIDGSLWACGHNCYGQLGDGTKNDRRTPQEIMSSVSTISAGYMHTMILKSDGSLLACGWNYSGQLGDGTTENRYTPKQIMNNVADVDVGSSHTLIVKTDDSLWACGDNDDGQLGDGTNVDRHKFVEITGLNVYITNITLNKSSITLQVGQQETLTENIKPTNATNKSVIWSSNKTSVATVNSNGEVTAVGAGTATITCTAKDGSGVSASCMVTVPAFGIEINATNFPDANFRNYLLEQDYGKDGVLTDDEIKGVTRIDCSSKNIKSLKGIEYFTVLTYLSCYSNQLTSLDVSKNTGLTCMSCSNNQLKGEKMDALINSLPQNNTGKLYDIDIINIEGDGNTCTKEQVQAAKAKGWIPMYIDFLTGDWTEYNPDEPIPVIVGDVNEDGTVNGTDLVALTNIILGKNAEKAAADVNGDGKVNGTDYVALANIILGKTSARRKAVSTNEMKQMCGTASVQLEPFAINAGETKVIEVALSNPNDQLTLMQFDLLLPKGLTLEKSGDGYEVSTGSRATWNHQLAVNMSDDNVRCLLASSQNALIEGSEGVIVRLTVTADADFAGGTIILQNVIGVSPNEVEVPMAARSYALSGDGVTGISTLGMPAQGGRKIYNLSGQLQKSLKKGVNIVDGMKVVK